MVLVRFGWIHTKFCSFALVVWHRLQQRKLVLAKNETHKKQKRNQNTESPRTTRQDSPQQKPQKQSWQVLIILCFPSFFSVCSGFVFFKPLYSLCCSAQKPGIQKGSKQIRYSNFWLERRKEESKIYERKGGQAHPSLEYIFWISGFDIWLDFRHGWTYGWIWLDTHTIIHHPTKSFCMSLYTNKYYLTYFFGSKEKESSKMYELGGTGSPLLGIHFWVNHDWMWSWLDLVGYTQNSVHLPL